MNVTCPDCRTVYRVDPRKVPDAGVVARCARCSAEFTVGNEAELAASASAEQAYVAEPVVEVSIESGMGDGSAAEAFVTPEPPTITPEAIVGNELTESAAVESPTTETAETGEWSFEGPTTIGEASYVGQDEESSPPDSASDVGSDERRSSDEGMTPDEGRIAVAVDFTPGRDEAEAPPSVAVSAEPDEPGRYEEPVVEPVEVGAETSPDYATADAQHQEAEIAEVAPVAETAALEDPDRELAEPPDAITILDTESVPGETDEPAAAVDHPSTIVLVDAMPDPPRVEPSAPEPWAASGEAPEDEPEEGRESVPSREREEVLVSANAGALDAVAGVATAPGAGEGFTSVPQRTDHELPLPPPPFGSTDPHARAKRLARALVSDIVVYNSDRRERSVRMGTVRQEFREEIRKSWEEYVAHVGNQLARDTSYFRDALNELLAGGNRLF